MGTGHGRGLGAGSLEARAKGVEQGRADGGDHIKLQGNLVRGAVWTQHGRSWGQTVGGQGMGACGLEERADEGEGYEVLGLGRAGGGGNPVKRASGAGIAAGEKLASTCWSGIARGRELAAIPRCRCEKGRRWGRA